MMKQTSVALSLALAVSILTACQTGAPTASENPAAQVQTYQAVKAIPVGAAPHGMWAAAGFVYNSSTGAGKLVVIDANTDTVVKEMPFEGGKPGYVKAFEDGKHVMVLDTLKGELRVIDPAQDHRVIQTIAVGNGPDKIIVDHDDPRSVFVSLVNEPKVVQLTFGDDRAQAPARKELAVGTVAGEGTKHRAIAFAQGRMVVPNSGENNVSLIDLATGQVDTVSDGNNPGPVAIGTTAGEPKVAVVGNGASNTVTLYDLAKGGKTTLSDVGLTPTDIGVVEQSGLAFVSMAGSNDVAVVDYGRRALSKRLPAGGRPVHVYVAPALPSDASGAGAHEVWVANDSGDSVTVIDGLTATVRATVAVGKGHHKMAFWGTKAYISNISDGTVSVVDRTMLK